MSLFQSLFTFAANVLMSTGYAGVFILMVAESATLPVPSEVVLPLAGYLVYQKSLDFWLVVIVASIGSLVGTLIDYAIGYYLGRAVVLRYGRTIRLNQKHLAAIERWFTKYGEITVLLARFVPLIRTLVAFPAGISKIKLTKFIAFSIVGIFVWDAILVYLGVFFGNNSNEIAQTLYSDFGVIEIAAIVIAVLVILVWVMRRRGTRASDGSKPEKTNQRSM